MRRPGGAIEGHIRIKIPTTLGVLHLAKMISDFQKKFDRVTFEVVLLDRAINPVDEGYDVVLTGLSESYEGVVDIPLFPLRRLVCASPDYLATRPGPRHPRDLSDHDCLVFKPHGASWQFESEKGVINVNVSQKLVTNDYFVLYSGARAGNGVPLLPEYLVKQDLIEGRLQAFLREYPVQTNWLKALVSRRREGFPHVSAFIEWLRAEFENVPWHTRIE
jgi:DNA-binding transcriptional LysR family regulator